MNAPFLWDGAEIFWDAFWILSNGRQIAMGFGVIAEQRIPLTEISRFARDRPWFAPGTDAFDVLVRVVQAMDRVFITHMAERRKADADAKRQQQASQAARSKLILPGSDAA